LNNPIPEAQRVYVGELVSNFRKFVASHLE
jgi:hypothetical protein